MSLYDDTVGTFLRGVNGSVDIVKGLATGHPTGITSPPKGNTNVVKSATDEVKKVEGTFETFLPFIIIGFIVFALAGKK